MIGQMRCCFRHAPGIARGADSAPFAGECDRKVVTTVVTAGSRKAVGKDAAATGWTFYLALSLSEHAAQANKKQLGLQALTHDLLSHPSRQGVIQRHQFVSA